MFYCFSSIPNPHAQTAIDLAEREDEKLECLSFFVSLESVKRQFKLYVCVAVCELTPHRLVVMVGTPVAALTLKL